jgi:hypothetical protein
LQNFLQSPPRILVNAHPAAARKVATRPSRVDPDFSSFAGTPGQETRMSKTNSLIAAALLIGCTASHAQSRDADTVRIAAAPATAAVAAGAPADTMFADALELYRSSRWSAAYGRFLRLADSGNADAARIALLMLRHGHDLYGTEWAAAPSQVTAWERMVGAAQPLAVFVSGE